ncbi:MAG: hypothetical protein AUK35_06890 [Zetaproteobacteria bacterium CG2_30_46_52]|nr:MAG: hypothetical protein AUK35_06890 [Zetaproteobacteria bacterium CG2_30_46_52]
MLFAQKPLPTAIKQQAVLLGEAVCQARKARGIKQAELAQTLNITIPTLRKLESGDASVGLNTCFAALLSLNIQGSVLQQSAPALSPLPSISKDKRNEFAALLTQQGLFASDAENAAWLLALTPQQRLQAMINQEKEQRLCGIALR